MTEKELAEWTHLVADLAEKDAEIERLEDDAERMTSRLEAMVVERNAEIERLRAIGEALHYEKRAIADKLARAEAASRELRELYAFPRLREIIDNALDREKEQGR